MDWIVSNAVLEKEIMRTTQAISAAKKNNADTSDLELRLQQLQLRQQLLIIQIQQGRITVESYMEMLKERIVVCLHNYADRLPVFILLVYSLIKSLH